MLCTPMPEAAAPPTHLDASALEAALLRHLRGEVRFDSGIILDFSKYMAGILEIDPARRIARVQPGVVLDHLRAEAEKHHLTFAPDPASHDRCTLGGMIGNNSCGVHSIMAGKTDDNIEGLAVLTYNDQHPHVGAT